MIPIPREFVGVIKHLQSLTMKKKLLGIVFALFMGAWVMPGCDGDAGYLRYADALADARWGNSYA